MSPKSDIFTNNTFKDEFIEMIKKACKTRVESRAKSEGKKLEEAAKGYVEEKNK